MNPDSGGSADSGAPWALYSGKGGGCRWSVEKAGGVGVLTLHLGLGEGSGAWVTRC